MGVREKESQAEEEKPGKRDLLGRFLLWAPNWDPLKKHVECPSRLFQCRRSGHWSTDARLPLEEGYLQENKPSCISGLLICMDQQITLGLLKTLGHESREVYGGCLRWRINGMQRTVHHGCS